MEQAREAGVMLPDKGASGYDSPGFSAAKALAQKMRDDATERRN